MWLQQWAIYLCAPKRIWFETLSWPWYFSYLDILMRFFFPFCHSASIRVHSSLKSIGTFLVKSQVVEVSQTIYITQFYAKELRSPYNISKYRPSGPTSELHNLFIWKPGGISKKCPNCPIGMRFRGITFKMLKIHTINWERISPIDKKPIIDKKLQYLMLTAHATTMEFFNFSTFVWRRTKLDRSLAFVHNIWLSAINCYLKSFNLIFIW